MKEISKHIRNKYMRMRRLKNPDKARQQSRESNQKFRKNNPERIKSNRRKWRNTRNAYEIRRRNRDSGYRLLVNLRNRMSKVLRGKNKSDKTITLLGCSIDDFRIYLETKFDVGMTWDNYGSAWHVDHIMPCAIFDLSKPEHQKRCFHFSNLQPMFAKENISKKDKIITNQFRLL